ncbi:unnamed protein product [Linum tenue]|uniref:Uncharacterized protein n=1 Tax=Linum tenue TaxID=586396 RepID=A0AAV0IJ50_9ROSI|nr:unnamed protein product [Linum tenue]
MLDERRSCSSIALGLFTADSPSSFRRFSFHTKSESPAAEWCFHSGSHGGYPAMEFLEGAWQVIGSLDDGTSFYMALCNKNCFRIYWLGILAWLEPGTGCEQPRYPDKQRKQLAWE